MFQRRLSTTAVVVLLLVACGGGGRGPRSTATTMAPPAIIPPRATTHDARLGAAAWRLTKGFRRVGPSGARAFEYLGTGIASANEAATTERAVRPGKIYVFSADVDPSRIVKGQFDLIVDRADGTSTYATFFRGRGPAGRVSTPPWSCPPGVTRVLLGMQMVGTIVGKGQNLTFSEPSISEIAAMP